MRCSTFLASLGLAASVALAAPIALEAPTTLSARSTNGQNVIYWGQNGGATAENEDLASYCTSTAGVDIVVLAFLYSFGASGNIPSGAIGQSCSISSSGQGSGCDALASAITTCQAAGVKVILSLGGASGAYSLSSDSQAQTIGQYLWDSYGNSGKTNVPRPFGKAFVNGFDFDIEVNAGSSFYPAMISTLRNNFKSDSSNTYYITGAPQCPIPEPNMGSIIQGAQFDYLFIQFYNNNPTCGLPFNGNGNFNYNDWVTFTAGTPSANAQLFIGVPAAPLASNGLASGEQYYITPTQLSTLVGQYKSATRFGGVMMWAASFSDSNVIDSCNFAQQAYAILATGSPCSSGAVSKVGNTSPAKAPVTTTAAASTPTATPVVAPVAKAPVASSSPAASPAAATPTAASPAVVTATATATATVVATGTPVAQWGQCGGNGYSGSTECQSPFKCVELSVWWSQCE